MTKEEKEDEEEEEEKELEEKYEDEEEEEKEDEDEEEEKIEKSLDLKINKIEEKRIKKKCSLEEHKEIDAILYCQDCKIYICKKCENSKIIIR